MDIFCPLMDTGGDGRARRARAGKPSPTRKPNYRSDWCLSRINQQNGMDKAARLEAGNCCECEVGLDLQLSLGYKY